MLNTDQEHHTPHTTLSSPMQYNAIPFHTILVLHPPIHRYVISVSPPLPFPFPLSPSIAQLRIVHLHLYLLSSILPLSLVRHPFLLPFSSLSFSFTLFVSSALSLFSSLSGGLSVRHIYIPTTLLCTVLRCSALLLYSYCCQRQYSSSFYFVS